MLKHSTVVECYQIIKHRLDQITGNRLPVLRQSCLHTGWHVSLDVLMAP